MATARVIRILPSARDVAVESARILLDLASTAVEAPFVALSGGSTPKAMYEHLRGLDEVIVRPLRNVHYHFGDERSVDNYHADSNVALAMDGFLRPLRVPYSKIHAPDGSAADLDAEAARLTRLLESQRGGPAWPEAAFDLVYLGMGNDGHTASLFPGTKALGATMPGIVANEVPQLSTHRLTLTWPILNSARHVVVMCAGEAKAEVLREVLEEAKGKYPIERLSPPRITWLIDEAAAGRLGRAAL